MNLKSKKGFTLVELIIVIAILGIIALIAVPNLTGIQQRSQVNADIRTAEQIGKAVRIYLTDTGAGTRDIGEEWIDYSTKTDLNSYVSLSYAPKSVEGEGKYWVKEFTPDGAAEGEVRIAVAIGTAAPESNAPYTAGAEAGIAYVEGASDLTSGIELMDDGE